MFNRSNTKSAIDSTTNTTDTIYSTTNSENPYENDKIKKRVITIFGTKYEIKHHSSNVVNSKFFAYVGILVSILKKKNIMDKISTALAFLCIIGLIFFVTSIIIKQGVIGTCIDDGLTCDYLKTVCRMEYLKYLEKINIRHITASPFDLSGKVRSCLYDNYNSEINKETYIILLNSMISCVKWFAYIVVFEIMILTLVSVVKHLINFSVAKYKEYVPDVNDIV
jgi:hypothetical protein